MIKKFNEFVNEDVYHGDFRDKQTQKSDILLTDEDDVYDTFMQVVLPNYSSEEIPSEVVPGLRNYIIDMFIEGGIKTVDDIVDIIDDKVKRGLIQNYLDY
ncbi:MAG: hypothetical protein ACOC3V_02560 [bacterium]